MVFSNLNDSMLLPLSHNEGQQHSLCTCKSGTCAWRHLKAPSVPPHTHSPSSIHSAAGFLLSHSADLITLSEQQSSGSGVPEFTLAIDINNNNKKKSTACPHQHRRGLLPSVYVQLFIAVHLPGGALFASSPSHLQSPPLPHPHQGKLAASLAQHSTQI